MKSKVFETKIKPLMEVIEKVCHEANISLLAQFDLDNGLIYKTGDLLLPTSDIITQIQHLEAKKGIKLIPNVDELKDKTLKDTLANVKLNFERELDGIVLTIQSGSYAIKVDVTDEVLPLLKEIN